jgi:hypothetical protein
MVGRLACVVGPELDKPNPKRPNSND